MAGKDMRLTEHMTEIYVEYKLRFNVYSIKIYFVVVFIS